MLTDIFSKPSNEILVSLLKHRLLWALMIFVAIDELHADAPTPHNARERRPGYVEQ